MSKCNFEFDVSLTLKSFQNERRKILYSLCGSHGSPMSSVKIEELTVFFRISKIHFLETRFCKNKDYTILGKHAS